MNLPEQSENTEIGKVARGASAQQAAALMNYGNLIAILLPFPLLIFWFGASMLVYAMNRHHPDPKVGHYTQQAAYRFYGITGFFVVAATFIPGGGWIWHLIAWIVAALILIPRSILDLRRIQKEKWCDIPLDDEGQPLPAASAV
ncbi:MAG: hypothetical protein QG599_1654 [Pseudomonadota bacterium]|nr:hypothetical protein [Pseudomonadota bacterium]